MKEQKSDNAVMNSTANIAKEDNYHLLKLKSLGIGTYRENIIYMRHDCQICISEGYKALTRVVVKYGSKKIVATLNVIYSNILHHNEAGLSIEAMERLGAKEDDVIGIFHLKPIESLSRMRAKMYGRELSAEDFMEIIGDIIAGHYSNVELAAFITACSGDHLTVSEITGLTKAMINSSENLNWGNALILDKHSVGGLPGNRTSPIIVSIVAAAGLTIPKTSSKAITSPAGTADMMKTITNVELSLDEIKTVIEKEHGCLVWGGAVNLSPADDILISVERALDIDSSGQMVASVLSKKITAGSTHVLIDIPVGPTAKIRSHEEALKLQYYFNAVSEAIGIKAEVFISDGTQPVGRGIGPALEAMDVLSVLKNEPDSPSDLRNKSVELAGILLELSGKYAKGKGKEAAMEILESGKAYGKFVSICKAQGGFNTPPVAKYQHHVLSEKKGKVISVDSRKLSRIAKLAGAPKEAAAGIQFFSRIGTEIKEGDLLFTIYAVSIGELEYAVEYLKNSPHPITIE